MKQIESRATLGGFKAILRLTRHRAQESKKIEDFNDSRETLNEDRKVDGGLEKLQYREIVDGAALSNLLLDMSRFWTSVSDLVLPVQHWLI
jgi:hypothetical protein